MGVTYYRRLSQAEGGACAAVRAWAALKRAARAWVALKRAAAGVARLYAARRRWRLRGGRVAAAARRAEVAAPGFKYDSASYARNFDDGAWMAEEGVSWQARSCRHATVQ
ncbi:uncharacterized protein LOC133901164 [Phragmites australis]|uniref:uncharacterized protein LOC133901164 n=1 Tax=Phragmites australis TaxID=29695 RepID=UPI002D79249C|nr:uncharacterized protein LOC133901164 [Phragmites australis]